MDMNFSSAELSFRDEVRRYFAEDYPKDILEKTARRQVLTKEDLVRSQKALQAKGWLAANWPVEYGGTGWSPTQRYIFECESALAGCPRSHPFGLKMVAPVIYTFGTEEQKRRFLPDILDSNVWWCQGYSEPGAGSDLASLRTKAVLTGDHYVVNGSKLWTTYAHYADWMFCLVRTDDSGKKQEGITFLLIDMTTPGITVQPIITMEGGHETNSVFFEDVKVPVANRIGEEGRGWTYAKYLLTHERTGQSGVARAKVSLTELRAFAGQHLRNGSPLIDDPFFMRRLVEVEVELMALEMTELRTLAAVETGDAPGPESSIIKIKGSELLGAVSELWVEAAAHYALPFIPESVLPGWNGEPVGPEEFSARASEYFNLRKLAIYGGSNEIQKNIISKAVLGL